MVRISKGRQRITMVKMENESNLQVTFSKRRMGVFKKSSELTTLCGVEMLNIVFSPGNKVFSFGHPSVDEIASRFMGTHIGPPPASNESTQQLVRAHCRQSSNNNSGSQLINSELLLMEGQEELEGAKKDGDAIIQTLRAGREQRWWERPMEEMSYAQLQHLIASLQNVDAMIAQSKSDISNPLHLLAAASSTAGTVAANPMAGPSGNYFPGGPSGHF